MKRIYSPLRMRKVAMRQIQDVFMRHQVVTSMQKRISLKHSARAT